MTSPDSIIGFWFGEAFLARNGGDAGRALETRSKSWWAKDPSFDAEVKRRFEPALAAAGRGELDSWLAHPRSRLALILLADQFSRNMYRGRAKAFAFDHLACRWCRTGLAAKLDTRLQPLEQAFFYMPLEHAESLPAQERSVALFEGLETRVPEEQKSEFGKFAEFARRHRDIVARFGRFPHRNSLLKRRTTAAEQAFLKKPGSSF